MADKAMTLEQVRSVVFGVYSDFCAPSFTDRRDHGPRLRSALAGIDAAIAARDAKVEVTDALQECLNRLVELSRETYETYTTETGIGKRARAALEAALAKDNGNG